MKSRPPFLLQNLPLRRLRNLVGRSAVCARSGRKNDLPKSCQRHRPQVSAASPGAAAHSGAVTAAGPSAGSGALRSLDRGPSLRAG